MTILRRAALFLSVVCRFGRMAGSGCAGGRGYFRTGRWVESRIKGAWLIKSAREGWLAVAPRGAAGGGASGRGFHHLQEALMQAQRVMVEPALNGRAWLHS